MFFTRVTKKRKNVQLIGVTLQMWKRQYRFLVARGPPLITMHAILESESYTIDAPACTRLVIARTLLAIRLVQLTPREFDWNN